MPKNIMLIPDDKGQIRLVCDGEEIVITVGAPNAAAAKPPSSNPPTQAGKLFPAHSLFEVWKHNTQIAESVPDGAYRFHTLGSHDELLKTLNRIGTPADVNTTHIVRVRHRGTLEFQHIADLNRRSLPNVQVIFSRDRE